MNSKTDSLVTPWFNLTLLSWDLYIWERYVVCQ